MAFSNMTKNLFFLSCLVLGQQNVTRGAHQTESPAENAHVFIIIDKNSPMEVFGASKIEAAINSVSLKPLVIDKSVATGKEHIKLSIVSPTKDTDIRKEGFRISQTGDTYRVTAIDDSGAMYGLMDLAEQIEMQRGLGSIREKVVNPRFPFRAIKFNLPWVSYRENESLQVNSELCKDLNMWRAFLDMMTENRLNALTLWSLHPFPYLIKAKSFPNATPFSDAELAEWKVFWTTLFRMAKERAIDTYIVNWNIIVSKSFRQHYGEGNTGLWADGYTSPKIEQYMRETVTQVINEYPDLAGLGITMGEAMQGWSGEQETEWMEKTFFSGIRVADRKVKFIYRAALDGDHRPHRVAIDHCGLDTPENPIIVELKFNWSHAHSTTTLVKAHGGGTGSEYWTNPAPTHHKMAWMIRNEDFFRLRWGEPDFIREHIQVNGQDYVGGYFIGSECYIPAKDIYHKQNHSHVNWKYAFERQWLYYKQWGRILYDPSTSDAVFANAFNQRFPGNTGSQMVEAYKLSTRTTHRIASFFNFTWDHSFYTEGLIGNKRDFITLQEMINAKPIEPTFVSIEEYGDGSRDFGAKITPLQQASSLETDNRQALRIVEGISTSNETLKCEIDDVKAWAHLGLYFAKKIRTAVAVNQNRKTEAVRAITEARQHWRDLVAVTDEHIQASHLAIFKETRDFHWKDFQDEVDAEVNWVKSR
ncbi:hypothetical protein ACFL5Z_02740 [Planctomycetota bacterium]